MKRIYLDYAASTPLDQSVKAAMDQADAHAFANPFSLHAEGRQARALIDDARLSVSKYFGCNTSEIIFTSGATEANALALRGILEFVRLKGERPHLVLSKIEHPSMREPALQLQNMGLDITWVGVDQNGYVLAEALAEAIKENTALVSVIYANHETGVVQNIPELIKVVKAKNPKTIFHTDASQALGWINCSVVALGADLMTISGHKIYGPKGIGVLYRKAGIKIQPMFPGFQEWGVRAGTESPVLITGFSKALSLVQEWNVDGVRDLREKLITNVLKNIDDVVLNTPIAQSVPHIAHFSFAGIDPQLLTIALDREGVAASSGSACSSGSLQSSHVVEALGLDVKKYTGSLRLSLGVSTTLEEVEQCTQVLIEVVSKLRG